MLDVSQGLNKLLIFIFVLISGKYLSCKLEKILIKVLYLFSTSSAQYTGAQSMPLNSPLKLAMLSSVYFLLLMYSVFFNGGNLFA